MFAESNIVGASFSSSGTVNIASSVSRIKCTRPLMSQAGV
jgi:hypothetical protein